MIAALASALALAAAPAGAGPDALDAELRAAREDRARIAAQVAKIEAFRASLSLPGDRAADERAALALRTSRDALAKAEARLRAAERRREDAAAAVAAERRAARCALAPLHDALRGHGPDAVALGRDLEREVEAALAAPRKTLASSEDDVVTVSRDLRKARPGAGVQAVADVLLVRSGATGDLRVQVRFSVGRQGRGTAEGQSVLVLDPSGRLADGEMGAAVRACIDQGP